MIALLPEDQRKNITRKSLIALEDQVVRALDFDFNYAGPLVFLGRYQRLLAVDQFKDEGSDQIDVVARQMIMYMQRHHEFLKFTPASQAAAALMLAINISYSSVSKLIGLNCLGEKFTIRNEDHEAQFWIIQDEIN